MISDVIGVLITHNCNQYSEGFLPCLTWDAILSTDWIHEICIDITCTFMIKQMMTTVAQWHSNCPILIVSSIHLYGFSFSTLHEYHSALRLISMFVWFTSWAQMGSGLWSIWLMSYYTPEWQWQIHSFSEGTYTCAVPDNYCFINSMLRHAINVWVIKGVTGGLYETLSSSLSSSLHTAGRLHQMNDWL